MFSRRVLQRILDSNAAFLTPSQVAEHVKRLNSGGRRVLQTEWEVVLLHAFNQVAVVEHEPELPSGNRLDIHATLRASPSWSFVADIVTVSDDGFHEQNPYDEFQSSVIRKAQEKGFSGAGFNVQVGGENKGEDYDRRRMKLALPRTTEEVAAFDAELERFLEEARVAPNKTHRIGHKEKNVDVTIEYTPGGRGVSGGYPSYTVAYGIPNSPIYRAIEQKARRLRSADAATPKGIIVCDGDCATLQDLYGSPGGFGLRDIVLRAMEKYEHIDFVLTIAVKDQPRSWMRASPSDPAPETHLFAPERSRTRVTDHAAAALKGIAARLPRFQRTPMNARAYTAHEHRKRTRYTNGGWKMADPEVRISARALLNLLTGTISQREFFEANGFTRARDGMGPAPINPFKALSKPGRLFVEARVESTPDEDDDWIVFTFGDPDPAVSAFRAP